MKFLFHTLIVVGLYGCSSLQDRQVSKYTIIEQTTIVDVINGSVIPNKTIIIRDSIIYKISDEYSITDYPNSNVIDGKGKFMIPGLWDMHFHLCWEKSNDSLLFKSLLSYGITGIRDMGGDLSVQSNFKNQIQNDPTVGPDIYGAGPIFDGNPPVFYDITIPLDKTSDINQLLDSIISSGSDFIKTYSLIREPELIRVSDYCRQHNIPFVGHLSEYIEPEKSIRLGQKSIEHLNVLDEIWMTSSTRMDSIIILMNEHKSWICPTLVIYDKKINISNSDIEITECNEFIHPMLMQEWVSSRDRRIAQNKEIDTTEIRSKYSSQLELVSYMNSKGIKILAGSDFAGMPFVYPGIGLHEELILLNKAGLSTREALATATINPAIYLSIEDKHGSVSEGKIANLVLLDKNPLDKIENTRAISTVIRKGKRVEKLMPIE